MRPSAHRQPISWRILLWMFTLILTGNSFLLAIERFPPPDFESGYELPVTQTVAPRNAIFEYVDIAVLVIALSLASYVALKKRSRKLVWLLMAASLAYFGFYRQGCVCSIGAIQNVTLAFFDAGYTIPIAVIVFFMLPLIFSLFFGRVFCAAVCPLGALQDIVIIKPLHLPYWLERMLSSLAYIYLATAILFAATGSAFIICQYDPFVGFFRMSGTVEMLIIGGCFLVIGLFIGRPYCRFLCPYGVLLRLTSRLSKRKVTITPAECIHCRLCENACPFGAIETPYTAPTARQYNTGRKQLLITICLLLPIITAGMGFLGYLTAEKMARMDYTVRLADRIYLEESGHYKDTIEESEAFRATGVPIEQLYQDSIAKIYDYKVGAILLGLFIGLVLSMKLVQLTVRRSRPDYQASRSSCLACGRCYNYCPVEHTAKEKSSIQKV